jgi:hypothetical protein
MQPSPSRLPDFPFRHVCKEDVHAVKKVAVNLVISFLPLAFSLKKKIEPQGA